MSIDNTRFENTVRALHPDDADRIIAHHDKLIPAWLEWAQSVPYYMEYTWAGDKLIERISAGKDWNVNLEQLRKDEMINYLKSIGAIQPDHITITIKVASDIMRVITGHGI